VRQVPTFLYSHRTLTLREPADRDVPPARNAWERQVCGGTASAAVAGLDRAERGAARFLHAISGPVSGRTQPPTLWAVRSADRHKPVGIGRRAPRDRRPL